MRRLGIDEPGRRAIAHHKGKASYCCVLVDRQAALLDRNIYLDVLPIHSKTTLTAHFERLGPPFCAQIESDSFDMWPAYGRVCHHFFPQAVRVVDRFHLVKAPLDALRRQQPQMEAFINIRWNLFKAHPTVAQQARLRAAFDHSPLLEAVVEMRDDFHARFESARDARQMEEVLQTWISQARALIHRDLAGLICTLRNWLPQIANFAHQRLTNAATEGLNNVI